MSMFEPISEARKTLKRIWDLLDKYVEANINIDELKELRDLLKERYKYASSLAEAVAIAALCREIEYVLSTSVGVALLTGKNSDIKLKKLEERVNKIIMEWEK